MGFGILIFGQNGAGKSTLAHALARETGWFEMDVEDYYFPSQRASRAAALDGRIQELPQSTDLPFSSPQSKEAVTEAIRADVLTHPHFILSGTDGNIAVIGSHKVSHIHPLSDIQNGFLCFLFTHVDRFAHTFVASFFLRICARDSVKGALAIPYSVTIPVIRS